MHPGSPQSRFVIFDLDGTLFDTRGDIARAVNAGLAAHGLPTAEKELIVSFVGNGVGRLVDRTLEAVGGDPALAPRVAQSLVDFYLLHPVDQTRPYPGVEAVLEALSDVPLAVASNKPTALCQMIVDHFGLTPRFREVLGGDWGGPRKPDPAVLLELARRLDRPASAGIMVGDSVMDLRAGQAASMRTVAALYGFRPAAELLAAGPDASVSLAADLAVAVPELLAQNSGGQ